MVDFVHGTNLEELGERFSTQSSFGGKTFTVLGADGSAIFQGPCTQEFHEFFAANGGFGLGAIGVVELGFECQNGLHFLFKNIADINNYIRFHESILDVVVYGFQTVRFERRC